METPLSRAKFSELLNQLKSGDQSAFTSIYSMFNRRIYLKVIQLVKEEAIAKDILQNVFMKIWEKRMQIDTDKSFQSFLYKMAINLVRVGENHTDKHYIASNLGITSVSLGRIRNRQ